MHSIKLLIISVCVFLLSGSVCFAGPWVGSGSAANIEDTAYSSGWNSDTVNAPSQNAIYDYLHLFDTDDDGSLIDEAALLGAFEAELDNSAGLLAALDDETGTGVAVFNTSPTLITPILGTITSGVGTALIALNGENIQDDTIDDDSIDWSDVTSTDITFDADTVPTTSVYSGTTSLEEATAADDSGAYIIGIFDEFTNSSSSTVQGVINDLDEAMVVGPASAITNNIITFSDTSGKVGKDSGAKIDSTGLTLVATPAPIITFPDSDSGDADTGVATIRANATSTGAGSVESDMYLSVKDGREASGSYTDAIHIDGSGTEINFLMSTSFPAGDIEPDELSVDTKFRSYGVTSLSDSTTPSVLTAQETNNTCISNYKSSGADHVFTMPAAHQHGNIVFVIGDEFQVDIEPNTGDLFYLNGTAMAVNEHIQNTADTLGQSIVGYPANINGTLRWMFKSSDSDFVEETP